MRVINAVLSHLFGGLKSEPKVEGPARPAPKNTPTASEIALMEVRWLLDELPRADRELMERYAAVVYLSARMEAGAVGESVPAYVAKELVRCRMGFARSRRLQLVAEHLEGQLRGLPVPVILEKMPAKWPCKGVAPWVLADGGDRLTKQNAT